MSTDQSLSPVSFRKETSEEIIADLPSDYKSLLGELVFLNKNCDESIEIDILSSSSEGWLDNALEEVHWNEENAGNEEVNADVDEENVDSSAEEITNSSETGDEEEVRNKSKDADEDSGDKDQDELSSSSQDEMNIRAEYAKKLDAINEEHKKKEAKCMAKGSKLPYTKREKLILIYYLIANNRIMGAKGRDIWVRFIDEGYLPHRTPKSVWNHVMQSIIPQIETFKLSKPIERMFLKLRNIRKRHH